MTWFGKYWKVLLAILLVIVAVLAVVFILVPQNKVMETEFNMAGMMTEALQTRLDAQLAENVQLAAIKDELPGAREEVAKSAEDMAAAMEQLEQDRATLYSDFPGGLKEEDQILYVMDLEDQLDMELMFGRTYDSLSHSEGRDINFAFGVVHPLIQLTDGSILCSVNVDIDFDMSYPEFKQMLRYLAQDERITSINYTKIDYDAVNNRVVGYATLLYYYLESEANLYVEPDMNLQTGKDNLFE